MLLLNNNKNIAPLLSHSSATEHGSMGKQWNLHIILFFFS